MARFLVSIFAAWAAYAQNYYTYVGNLASDSVLLAWGTADGANTIGRSSPSHGNSTVKIAGRTLTTRENWIVVGDLSQNTEYPYEVLVQNQSIGQGSIRTWPQKSDKLVFFVIGDWGTGKAPQYRVAQAMVDEFQKRSRTSDPVRFVLTTGDNIYGDFSNMFFGFRHTGSLDLDWEQKFFRPYDPLLKHIPFYPTLGNHDGNETESRADLPAYLDNFFFPNDKPARYYSFSYGGLADFFGLDSTYNSEAGPPRGAFSEDNAQFRWMQTAMEAAKAPWKIPYFHHPPFNAGPGHAASLRDLSHFVALFEKTGVKVAFNGHEHNFQVSEQNAKSGNIRFVVSGAGGELRAGSVRSKMKNANIAAWAPQNHFLVVSIEGKTMKITPVSDEPVTVMDSAGRPMQMPFVVNLP